MWWVLMERHPVRSLRNLPEGLIQVIFRYRRPGIPTASGSQFGSRVILTPAASGQDQPNKVRQSTRRSVLRF
jgi:hypothetical protein